MQWNLYFLQAKNYVVTTDIECNDLFNPTITSILTVMEWDTSSDLYVNAVML